MTVIEAFAVVGLDDQGPWAHSLLRCEWRAIGTAEREGAAIVLRDTRGQRVQRIRTGRSL